MRSTLLKAGATSPQLNISGKLAVWKSQHQQQAVLSVQRLLEKPVTNTIILFVLGIAVLLPVLLFIGLKNVEHWIGYANNGLEVSAYLQKNIDGEQAEEVVLAIASWPEVAASRYISPEDAVAALQNPTETAEIIASLPANPLPASIQIVLHPSDALEDSAQVIVERLRRFEMVESASFNVGWFRKAEAILLLFQRLTASLAALLGIGVALVIGNTIKLAIEARREEILVSRLVGATNGFVRRPFLYMGALLGALGALLAIVVAQLCVFVLTYYIEPIEQAYNSTIDVSGLPLLDTFLILLGCTALGWLGAWLISSAQIRALEPQ